MFICVRFYYEGEERMPVRAGIYGQDKSIEKVEYRLWGEGAELTPSCLIDEELSKSLG